MNNHTTDAIMRGFFPGCAWAFFNGSQIEIGCKGTLALIGKERKERKVTEDTLYDLASLTKIIVFVGIHKLVDQGLFSLDTRLADILTFGKEGEIKKATVRHLLSCALDFVVSKEMEIEGIHLKNEKGHLRFFDEVELRGPLGSMFRYGNFSAFIAGKLLEEITKMDLEKALRTLVLRPLDMTDTSFRTREGARGTRTAPTQNVEGGYWEYNTVQDYMSRKFLPEHVGIAGLFSSILDMQKLAWFLATGLTPFHAPFIDPLLWREIVTDQYDGRVVAGNPRHYGLGIDIPGPDYVSDNLFCRTGVVMSGASGPFIFACPEWYREGLSPRPVGGVILSNTDRTIPDAKKVHRAFRQRTVETFLGGIKE